MSVCVNDTDGDGNCPACARNPEAPCRMVAREALIWRCTQAGLSEHWATRQVDNFAHELAEKIRGLPLRCSHCVDEAADEGADLIDPEVSTDG